MGMRMRVCLGMRVGVDLSGAINLRLYLSLSLNLSLNLSLHLGDLRMRDRDLNSTVGVRVWMGVWVLRMMIKRG